MIAKGTKRRLLTRSLINLMPPLFIRAGRVARDRYRFRTNVSEWEVVSDGASTWENGRGWSDQSIVEVQKRQWTDFIETTTAPKQFGTWPGGKDLDIGLHNLIMTFGYVLGRAAKGRNRLSILDWGGGLGHYSVYARELHPELEFDYAIKDLSTFCETGRTLLNDVRFIEDDGVALAGFYDLVFASSSIQYSRDLHATAGRLARCSKTWLMFTRIPCIAEQDDFVVLQRPWTHGYKTEYPCWFINRGKFIRSIESCGFALRREFLQTEAPLVRNAKEQCRYTGFLFERRGNNE